MANIKSLAGNIVSGIETFDTRNNRTFGIDSDTLLLLHMNGASASTTFPDSSQYARTITVNGGAKISTDYSKFGGSSGVFDGNGDAVYAAASADWAIGAGDFCAEGWFRWASNTSPTNQWLYSLDNAGSIGIAIYYSYNATTTSCKIFAQLNPVGTTNTEATFFPVVGNWYHIAHVRKDGVVTIYINGYPLVSATKVNSLNLSTASLYVGNRYDLSTTGFNGYINEFRFSRVARYTDAFTPPTRQFT